MVRDPRKLARPVRTVTADMAAADPAALEPAVAGVGAVLSGLGPHSNADAGIAARGTRAIVAAMQAAGVRRIVAVSALPVSTVPAHWEAWLGGLQVKSEGMQTIISGLLPDQPALYGLLAKIGDLGLCLISVRQLDPDEPGKTDQR